MQQKIRDDFVHDQNIIFILFRYIVLSAIMKLQKQRYNIIIYK